MGNACPWETRNLLWYSLFIPSVTLLDPKTSRLNSMTRWFHQTNAYIFSCFNALLYHRVLSCSSSKKAPNFYSYLFQNLFSLSNIPSWCFQPRSLKQFKAFLYNPHLTRDHNRKEGESFVEEHHNILNYYNIWREPGHDIYSDLPLSCDPRCLHIPLLSPLGFLLASSP